MQERTCKNDLNDASVRVFDEARAFTELAFRPFIQFRGSRNGSSTWHMSVIVKQQTIHSQQTLRPRRHRC